MTITRDHVEAGIVTESEVHRFTAFASDLEFPVGEWPSLISTTLGNGQPFVVRHHEVDDGDLQWVTYQQSLGCITLKIYND